jgi:hypothetical protein
MTHSKVVLTCSDEIQHGCSHRLPSAACSLIRCIRKRRDSEGNGIAVTSLSPMQPCKRPFEFAPVRTGYPQVRSRNEHDVHNCRTRTDRAAWRDITNVISSSRRAALSARRAGTQADCMPRGAMRSSRATSPSDASGTGSQSHLLDDTHRGTRTWQHQGRGLECERTSNSLYAKPRRGAAFARKSLPLCPSPPNVCLLILRRGTRRRDRSRQCV